MPKIQCWECVNGNCVEKSKCSNNSCKVDCLANTDGFCCIDHILTNQLFQVLGYSAINAATPNNDICLTQEECNNSCNLPATSTTEGWYFRVYHQLLINGNGDAYAGYVYTPCFRDSVLIIQNTNNFIGYIFPSCGSQPYREKRTTITRTDHSLVFNYLASFTPSGALKYGILPENTVVLILRSAC